MQLSSHFLSFIHDYDLKIVTEMGTTTLGNQLKALEGLAPPAPVL